jgi:hypothetical protein
MGLGTVEKDGVATGFYQILAKLRTTDSDIFFHLPLYFSALGISVYLHSCQWRFVHRRIVCAVDFQLHLTGCNAIDTA